MLTLEQFKRLNFLTMYSAWIQCLDSGLLAESNKIMEHVWDIFNSLDKPTQDWINTVVVIDTLDVTYVRALIEEVYNES